MKNAAAKKKQRKDEPCAIAPPAQPTNRKRAVALKLSVIARQLWQRFDQSVERDGLTRAKWTLIATVSRNPGATQRAIAEMLEVRDVTAGQLIDRLCADGYLERRENPKDRRAYYLYPTPAAQPVLKRLSEVAKIHEEETFAGFSGEDLAQLENLLDAIARNVAALRSKDAEKKLLALRERAAD